jgi:hypothetical protein
MAIPMDPRVHHPLLPRKAILLRLMALVITTGVALATTTAYSVSRFPWIHASNTDLLSQNVWHPTALLLLSTSPLPPTAAQAAQAQVLLTLSLLLPARVSYVMSPSL